MPRKATPFFPDVRFWPKVDMTSGPNGCWLWTGFKQKNADGSDMYGSCRVEGVIRYAHRIAWQLAHPEGIPPRMVGRDGIEGKTFVLHNCPGGDNPACVNDAHLWLGTDHDNMADM